MNIFRKILWKLSKNNISLITCPTKETRNNLIKYNVIDETKIIYLPDPVIDIKEICYQKKIQVEKNKFKKNSFVLVGRYTKQKNHLLAIKCFKKLLILNKNLNLCIIGEGELKKKYENEIEKQNLAENIHLINYQKNIHSYLSKSAALISTSLWEDPGFVMIEAAASNTLVISSNCMSGPKEFIGKKNGILFENNDLEDFEKKMIEYLNMSEAEIHKMRIGAKKMSINYTKLRHFKILTKYLV